MTTDQNTHLSRYRQYSKRIGEITMQPKTKVYSSAVFSFLAISLFGLYAILPTIRTILFLRREIADKTVVNKKMEDKISALIESQASYEAASPQLSLVNEALPENTQPIELTRMIRNLAQSVNASISAIQMATVDLTTEVATASGLHSSRTASFPLTIIINGSYNNVKNLLDGLLAMRRIITIESIRFTQAGDSAGLQLVLQLKAYYQTL